MARVYDRYKSKMQKVADINHAIAVLSWDKEVNLPKDSAPHRSQQVATLAGMSHNEFVSKDFGALLNRLANMKSLSAAEKKNISVTLDAYQKATKFSEAFIIRKSTIESNAYHAWLKAREANDYGVFKDALKELVDLKREEAKKLKATEHPYDALLDIYEPGLTVAQLDPIFGGIKISLKKLIKKINKSKQVKNNFLRKRYSWNKQWEFGLDILENMGYDFNRGRQDISAHPFTTSFSPTDVRVTTRVDENDFAYMLWSTIHEGGHALYEQGLSSEEYGLPTGSYISLSIHESQSRLWENHVGRSKEYWSFWYPSLQAEFPKNLNNVSLNKFYAGINRIAPNLIRTEADELHYHFHVLIRYEIEKGLIEGSIDTDNLSEVWNEKYKEYLGISAKDDNTGVLQDVHWGHGSFGYFPTYSLGSFYAAQFYAQAEKDIPKLNKKIAKGNTTPLLNWLRENIHQHGRRYEADELCNNITGESLNVEHFLNYANTKFKSIYKK
ncbi:MAG: carboxypeptidase M32 [Saprospiraceae bacterium]|nr:carboxypeptidase M32 [Saprospiraceae bacterium]